MPRSSEHHGAAAAALSEAEFAALFRAQFQYVYRNLRRLGVPAAAVDDAVQEVFLVALRRYPGAVASPRGWLFGVVRRIAFRVRRGAARQDRLVQALAREPAAADDGAAALARREATRLLEQFLGRLDDDKRAVFVLAELEQMPAAEIARTLEIKENTVYSRLRAARLEFDRSFARVRLRERRATGELAGDERALLLTQARRAYAPGERDRARAWACLVGPLGLGAPAVPAAEAAAAPWAASSVAAGHGGAWLATVGLVGLLAVTSGQARPPAPDPGRVSAGPPGHARKDSPAPAATASPALLAPAPARAPEPPPRSARRAPVPPASSPVPPVTVAAPDADALQREAALMAEARAAIRRGDLAGAQGLLARHGAEFPGGALIEERRLSLVAVLCSQGQVEAARAEAAVFLRARPDSALARRAATICAAGTGEGAPGG